MTAEQITGRLYAHSMDDQDPTLMDDAAWTIKLLSDALTLIQESHTPDQPTASGGTETEWVKRHVAYLRGIAMRTLAAMHERTA